MFGFSPVVVIFLFLPIKVVLRLYNTCSWHAKILLHPSPRNTPDCHWGLTFLSPGFEGTKPPECPSLASLGWLECRAFQSQVWAHLVGCWICLLGPSSCTQKAPQVRGVARPSAAFRSPLEGSSGFCWTEPPQGSYPGPCTSLGSP